MSRRPPESPLFPYTTLFRSSRYIQRMLRAEHRNTNERVGLLQQRRLHAVYFVTEQKTNRESRAPIKEVHGAGTGFDRRDLDRKSTRLNSSHGYISYADFCLK